MPLDPGDNLKAAEDFLLIVLHCHVVAAAKVVLSNKEHPADLESSIQKNNSEVRKYQVAIS